MNKSSILNFKFEILNSFFKAYQGLKEWCDPAFEGSPYTNEHNVEEGFKPVSNWTNRVGFRQRLMLQKI